MRKKVLSLLLALMLGFGLAVPAMAAESGFTDVDPNAYYADAVAWAVKNNITNGTSATTFSPENTCTRGQIITFLWRAARANHSEGNSTASVSDIAPDDYFYKAVLWAKEQGMFEGDTFRPNDPCTRLMAVEFMWKRIGSPKTAGNSFSDVNSDAVNWAVHNEITSGTSATTFSPDNICTRGQIVTFLYRAYSHGYDYETLTLVTFPFEGTYVRSLGYIDGDNAEWYYKLTIKEGVTDPAAGVGGTGITYQTWIGRLSEEDPQEELLTEYQTFFTYGTARFDLRYYEDFLVLIGKTDHGRQLEGIYIKEGHTLPDWAKEAFADFLSGRQ